MIGYILLTGIVALVVGGIAIWVVTSSMGKNRYKRVSEDAKRILEDAKAEAEVLKKDKMLEAKEHFLSLKSEHEKQSLKKLSGN